MTKLALRSFVSSSCFRLLSLPLSLPLVMWLPIFLLVTLATALPTEKIEKIEAGGYLQYSGLAPHAPYEVKIELLTPYSLLRLERDGIFLTFTCPSTIRSEATPVEMKCVIVVGDVNARLRLVNGNFLDAIEVRSSARIQLDPPSSPVRHPDSDDPPEWLLGVGIILIIFMIGTIFTLCVKTCRKCCCESSVDVRHTYSVELTPMPSTRDTSSPSAVLVEV